MDTPQEAVARYTYWLTLLTFAMAICNVALWLTTRKATIAAKCSADAAVEANRLSKQAQITGQRAWINIENVELVPPTRFDEDRRVLRVAVTTKNLGQTPALSVEISVDSFVSGTEPFRAAESKFLSSLRRQPEQLGTLLFPQDILVQRVLWADDLSERRDSVKSKVNLIIFVGVCYRVTGDETVHVTYQPYSMLNIQHGMFVADGQTVAIPRMAFLAGIAD